MHQYKIVVSQIESAGIRSLLQRHHQGFFTWNETSQIGPNKTKNGHFRVSRGTRVTIGDAFVGTIRCQFHATFPKIWICQLFWLFRREDSCQKNATSQINRIFQLLARSKMSKWSWGVLLSNFLTFCKQQNGKMNLEVLDF